MKIQEITITKINPAPYNPRKDLRPEDPEYQRLLTSMNEFGCVEPLIWNRKTGNLVGGHQRFKILLAQGTQQVSVSVVDLPLEKEKALNIALNKISGEWDEQKLSDLLEELVQMPDFDIELTGFDLSGVEGLLGGLPDETTWQDMKCDSSPATVITQPGDLLELGPAGEHQILCGDATDFSLIHRLMGGELARLCHTDPPYGVDYHPENRPGPKGKRIKKSSESIRNDDLPEQEYVEWFGKVTESVNLALRRGASFYIWNSHKQFGLMHQLLGEKGFKVSSVITWVKESFAPGFGDYNEQTEFCLYGWKGGAKHRWFGPNNESTFWEIHRDLNRKAYHPTQKPLALAERAIRNSSKAGDLVFDPFLGSGTTLIAAARLGRRCFGMEIDPHHCDVIVRRYIALAGPDAVSSEIAERYALPAEEAVS